MMMQFVCQLLGHLLIICIAAFDLLQQLWVRLHALASRSYDYLQCDQRAFLDSALRGLEKLPKHLVLVVGPDDCYVDVALLKRIFSYAQIVGIPYLSVYDTRTQGNGYVDLSLFCQLDEKSERCFHWPSSSQAKEQKLIQNGHKINQNGTSNGYASNGAHQKQLQVYQITRADGHALIADVCRELYESRKSVQVQAMLEERQKLTNGINGMLNKRLGYAVPEPELGIVFSRQTCTYGLLPWHVRFTEFHTHRSGSYFDAKSFAQVLYKYARCEQRWGK
ncbi:PREDICTED: dehydrodolichyl diphosphate synthase complex subunit nus1 [Drosophila arizonae]|uniref:ditrans,polycis-polyprenyl diphosphate synthase [(2E,6E)-farnesyldiphosphate specific] n=1 Tax=Drosophila arizonae TaxID=7263 RepID=A0ABM1NXC5_DROAR|nr:PREDICTED: dehydrodolichyl diphosphate synthase complex subunit nus1 [Drosophila arizonae]